MTRAGMTHPPETTLAAFAAGDSPRSERVLVEAHLAFCPDCSVTVGDRRRAGPRLPAETAAEADGAGDGGPTIEAILAAVAAREHTRGARPPEAALLPPGVLAELEPPERWAWIEYPAVGRAAQIVVEPESGTVLNLVRFEPASTYPRHGHSGIEEVVVLEGGYHDGNREVLQGDWAVADTRVAHAPATRPDEGCWCLLRTSRLPDPTRTR